MKNTKWEKFLRKKASHVVVVQTFNPSTLGWGEAVIVAAVQQQRDLSSRTAGFREYQDSPVPSKLVGFLYKEITFFKL